MMCTGVLLFRCSDAKTRRQSCGSNARGEPFEWRAPASTEISRMRREAVGSAVECRTCSRTDYPPTPAQREALQRNQRSLSVGECDGAELRGSYLDDLQTILGA